MHWRLVLFVVSLAAQASPPREPASAQPTPPSPQPQSTPDSGERQPFVLGILRRDGGVTPFAAFDGKVWTSPWPEDVRRLDLPISVDAIPDKWWGKAGVPTEMTIWANGARRGTLHLTRPTMLAIMCSRRLALLSSYQPSEAVPPPRVQPYPKDGLVISGGQPIEPIETVARTSPDWVQAAVALIDPFDAAEVREINAFTDWKHPLKRPERRKVPVELETLYRAPMDTSGWTAYHVEAVKRYPSGPDDGDCGLVTYVSGWILNGPEGKARAQLNAQVTYCERRNNTFMLPLGLIKHGGRTYWVYQASSYEREGYVVTRLTPKANEAHVQSIAGSCF